MKWVVIFFVFALSNATNLLIHAYEACLDAPECMDAFHLTIPYDRKERKDFNLVFDYLLAKESKKNFKLAKNNDTLTAMLYWNICEAAEKLNVYCKHKVSRGEIDDMLAEMETKKTCGKINR
jgi:hypothetical protein